MLLSINFRTKICILITLVSSVVICEVYTAAYPSSASVLHGAEGNLDAFKILPLGDSITQGDIKHNTYRRPLWLLLQEAGYNVDFVGSQTKQYNDAPPPDADFDHDHEGHYGWRADNILDGRYEAGGLADWLVGYTPDAALIHLGTNDLRFGDSPQDTVEELKGIIELLRADNQAIAIFVAQIIPRVDMPEQEAIIQEFNALIPTLAAEMDLPEARVLVVDQYSHFDATTDTFDGVHPNQSGETKIAQRWFEALGPILDTIQTPATITPTLTVTMTLTVPTSMPSATRTPVSTSPQVTQSPVLPTGTMTVTITPTGTATLNVTPTLTPIPDIHPLEDYYCVTLPLFTAKELGDPQSCLYLPFITSHP